MDKTTRVQVFNSLKNLISNHQNSLEGETRAIAQLQVRQVLTKELHDHHSLVWPNKFAEEDLCESWSSRKAVQEVHLPQQRGNRRLLGSNLSSITLSRTLLPHKTHLAKAAGADLGPLAVEGLVGAVLLISFAVDDHDLDLIAVVALRRGAWLVVPLPWQRVCLICASCRAFIASGEVLLVPPTILLIPPAVVLLIPPTLWRVGLIKVIEATTVTRR
mmetsp:Transcript_69237/g.166027  ORF Transcript_69237/g.166027 Transcript_69237/m.166027 type:complete len:217 (+) Transcript_69237:538-1188(+)